MNKEKERERGGRERGRKGRERERERERDDSMTVICRTTVYGTEEPGNHSQYIILNEILGYVLVRTITRSRSVLLCSSSSNIVYGQNNFVKVCKNLARYRKSEIILSDYQNN